MNKLAHSTALMNDNSSVDVWYFTFGANMNKNTLQSRGISPSLSLAGSLPDHYLAFNFNGYDLVEPRFANIEPLGARDSAGDEEKTCDRSNSTRKNNDNTCQSSDIRHVVTKGAVQGIAHRITSAEMLLLDSFEGAGTAYERFETEFKPLNGDNMFLCYAYRAYPKLRTSEGQPSARYLTLLVEGAESAGLPSSYIAELRNTPCLKSQGATEPEGLASKHFANNSLYFNLNEVKQHDFNNRNETLKDLKMESFWVTVGGWIFDVSEVISHRAMLRKMSGIDGTFYCLNLWATTFGTGDNEADSGLHVGPVVDMLTLSTAQQEYIFCWLHHLYANYPLIGRLDTKDSELNNRKYKNSNLVNVSSDTVQDTTVSESSSQRHTSAGKCGCGCVPNIMSLFEMAALREQRRQEKKSSKK